MVEREECECRKGSEGQRKLKWKQGRAEVERNVGERAAKRKVRGSRKIRGGGREGSRGGEKRTKKENRVEMEMQGGGWMYAYRGKRGGGVPRKGVGKKRKRRWKGHGGELERELGGGRGERR